jgi:hypothetical protein
MSCKTTPNHQQLPKSGILAGNLDVDLPGWGSDCPETQMPDFQPPEIGDLIEGDAEYAPPRSSKRRNIRSSSRGTTLTPDDSGAANRAKVFAHVLTTVEVKSGKFIQTGCAPNFQGDCITLCTCMHRHRTWRKTWKGVWVAGFSGKVFGNQLFYLMQVGQETASQYNLWNSGYLPSLSAKSAALDVFGDIFEPLLGAASQPFNPSLYRIPHPNHVHMPTAWLTDICYGYPTPSKMQPKMLVGVPARSFLWSSPKYRYRGWQHPRFKFYQSLRDFYNHLI